MRRALMFLAVVAFAASAIVAANFASHSSAATPPVTTAPYEYVPHPAGTP